MQKISLRTFVVMMHDIVVIMIAYYLANRITHYEIARVPQSIDSVQHLRLIILLTLNVIVVQFSCFYYFGLYKAILRFSSIPDLVRIIRGVAVAVPLSMLFSLLVQPYERSLIPIFFIDSLLLLFGLSAGRLAYRIMKDNAIQKLRRLSTENEKRTLIIGAGTAGERLLRDISVNPNLMLKVAGFIDDDRNKHGKSIRGVNILGAISDLPKLIEIHRIQHVIIAMPSASRDQIRKISQICKNLEKNIELKILPRMIDVLDGNLSYKTLRNIGPEDLLGRKAHDLNIQQMSAMLHDKIILITGAGGSIGSELCKQVAKFEPKSLILFETTELFLYDLENSLRSDFPNLNIIPIMGDVRKIEKVKQVFDSFKPQVIFHSAAYKHVPLMELNPLEAIHTNVIGTLNVAKLAVKNNVDRFVLISTDKAINPTNIMGASKRIAELTCQYLQTNSQTKFITVRFGNVLGSSGSVIPLFKKQIEKGGPVTVTHPDMKRYFMSIPEATQLVIQAGSIGNGGEVMVLDMGEPIRIQDLAKEMITLAGHKLEEIKIEFTGLRPGEKLFEELFHKKEIIIQTGHPLVKIAKTPAPQADFYGKLDHLMTLPEGTDIDTLRTSIQNLVPEYTPSFENNINTHLQKNLSQAINA